MTAALATIEDDFTEFLPPPLRARPARQIHDDAEALAIAEEVSTKLAEGAAARDRDRILPYEEMDLISDAGLLAIESLVAMRGISFEQTTADARVLTLETRNIGGVTARERIGFAHQHFHLGKIAHVVFEMAADEEAQALLGILGLRYSRFSERDELLERAARDEVEQLFLVAQVVVDAREGNSTGRARANRAMVASCSKVARSESRCNARSAKKSTATSALNSSAKNVRTSFQKRLRRTSFEQVPCAAHRLQMTGIFRIAFDFLAQSADVHIHAARRHETVRAPHGIQKLIPRKHAVRA